MEVRAGYRQTDIGILPSNWGVKTLRSMTTLLTNGFVGRATDFYIDSDDGVLYIQGYNVEENGFNLHGIKHVSKEFHAQHKKSCLQKGDLLTIQTGDIGVTTVVPDQLAGANCHALIISRFYKDNADPDYYCQYFNSQKTRAYFKEIETGTTMKHLNVGDMATMQLPVPLLPEQHAIATALSDIDALIISLDRLIAKKCDIKQATMQELLTGKRRLPGFSGEWVVKKLGELGECLIGLTYSPSNVTSDGLLVLRSSNIADGTLKFEDTVFVNLEVPEKIIVKTGDILICVRNGSRELIGKCALIDENAEGMTFGAFMGVFRTPFNRFVFYQFQTNFIKKQIREHLGATINQITNKSLNSFQIPFPIDNKEQEAIATVLSDMDTELAALELKRDKTKAIKQGMKQELLTGRIRLT